jgi:hypothetical protein
MALPDYLQRPDGKEKQLAPFIRLFLSRKKPDLILFIFRATRSEAQRRQIPGRIDCRYTNPSLFLYT